ncbi:MAG: diguanylate cyclase [Candidatus Nanopelagicales bacterium]
MANLETPVDTSRPVEIAEGIFWVGVADHPLGLQCNPYLMMDDDDAILVDPGSVLDFEYVLAQVEQLIPVNRISTITLSHQDPDLCSSVPLFEKAGFQGVVATHWRASVLQRYYNFASPFYLVNEHDYRLELRSGRPIDFIPTPYLHFPGAVATFDPRTKVLFPGDLFGAFSVNWSFKADKDVYIEGMKAFHEHYMPSNDNLRPVMEVLLGMDISVIAPQHGSVITEDIRDYIVALRDLECGTMLRPIKKELSASGGYTHVVEEVIRRLCSVFDPQEVLDVFSTSHLRIDPSTLQITDFTSTGFDLWNDTFETIAAEKGQRWLTVIGPLVEKLSHEYDIAMPRIYQTAQVAAAKQLAELTNENDNLRELNERLDATLRDTEDRVMRCPITGLHNEYFFTTYLESTTARMTAQDGTLALLCVGIDNFTEIAFTYGKNASEEALRAVAYLLQSTTNETDLTFRLDGPIFAVLVADSPSHEDAQNLAERLRNTIAASPMLITNVTASVGIAYLDEQLELWGPRGDISGDLANLALLRMHIARNRGGDGVCATSDPQNVSDAAGAVLIVDPDPVSVDVLGTALKAMNYRVLSCEDGIQALRIIDRESIDVVIVEAVLPRMDAFAMRESLLEMSEHKDLPFVLVSYEKDPETIARAQALRIDHFFQKPYLLSELVGTVRLQMKTTTT